MTRECQASHLERMLRDGISTESSVRNKKPFSCNLRPLVLIIYDDDCFKSILKLIKFSFYIPLKPQKSNE